MQLTAEMHENRRGGGCAERGKRHMCQQPWVRLTSCALSWGCSHHKERDHLQGDPTDEVSVMGYYPLNPLMPAWPVMDLQHFVDITAFMAWWSLRRSKWLISSNSTIWLRDYQRDYSYKTWHSKVPDDESIWLLWSSGPREAIILHV